MSSSTILRLFVFALLFLVRPLGSNAQQSCYNIIGYLPSWVGEPSSIDYSKYSHINYAFGIPNSNGTINSIENSSKLIDLVTRAHSNNTQVLLSVGGWLDSSPDNTPFEAIANNSTSITQFVNSCANLITQYNLDGIDIDWEFPSSQTKWNNVMRPLATRVHGAGKLLTAAVPSDSYYGNNVGDLTILDLVNIMAYDCACPSTAPYSQAVDALNYWSGRGVPIQKRMLGVPFYSSDNNTSLHVQKANLVKSNGGGIMIWDIGTYYGDITSIYNTLGSVCKGNACVTVSIPGKLEGETYCSGSGVSSEATTDTGGGRNLSSIETNDWAAYRINVPTAGTYNVQYRVASLNGGGSLRLEKLGGGTVYGTVAIPQTGGWQTWTTVSQNIQLSAGEQDIALVGAVGGFNVNWITFSAGTCTTPPSQPGTITGGTSVTAGTNQTYSVTPVSGAASYTWTLPSGWQGSSTTNALTTTVGSSGGSISVVANNACGSSPSRTLTVSVVPAASNLALNKPVVASSTEAGSNVTANAVDGNTATRWSSLYSDPQWIYVDLQGSYNINRVKITWEAAYASAYQIQVSGDAVSWTTIRSVTGNASVVNDQTGLNGTGRYLRIYGTTRATQWGYSIIELEVYGTPATGCTVPSQPGAIAGNANVTSGSSQTYSVAAVSGATSYTWTLPSGWSGSSTSNAITITAGSAGGTVSVVANNSCGSSVARTLTVTVTGAVSNIAYNKPVTVTSIQGTGFEGARAVDANGTTRWSSASANNQNFVVDLGANYNINRIRIAWEAAYARDYQIQVSTNNSTWTTIKEFWGKSTSAADDYTGLNSTARWLKVYCINRATQYGFSIFEFEAYGSLSGARQFTLAPVIEPAQEETEVYPNPTSGKVVVKIPLEFENGKISLLSSEGRSLISEAIKESAHTFDLTDKPAGLYYIRLSKMELNKVLKLYKK